MENSRKLFRANGFEFPFEEASASEMKKVLAHGYTVFYKINAPLTERASRTLSKIRIPTPRRLEAHEDQGNYVPDVNNAYRLYQAERAHLVVPSVQVDVRKCL